MSDRSETRARRLAPRCSLTLEVRVAQPGSRPVSCQARNVSAGGMFLATDAPLRLASELSLELSLPRGRSATLEARVVHVLGAQDARALGLTPGIGVRFSALTPDANAIVSELIEMALAQPSAPRSLRLRPGAELTALVDDPLQRLLLGFVDGRRDLDALARELALEVDTVERMLGPLRRGGVVELAPQRRSQLPPAASTQRPSAGPSRAPVAVTRSGRAPQAGVMDAAAAAEAARVAAVSSARSSQPPAAPRPTSVRPSGPPPASLAGSVRPPASRAPSFRPARASGAPLGAAAQILAQAEAAYGAGEAVEAARHLKLLSAMTFDDARTQQRAAELKQQVLHAAAVTFEKQALHEEGRKQWDKAAAAWLRVAEGRPQDGTPLQRAAQAQLHAGSELRVAMETARRAVELAPDDAQAHRVLAQVYTAAGMQANATRALEAARRCAASSEPREGGLTPSLFKRLFGRDGD